MTTSPAQVVAVLKAARERVERHWVPRAPNRNTSETCAMYAIGDACEECPDAYYYAQKALRDATGVGSEGSLADWSDAGPKSKVLAGFDAAIALAEQERAE